MADFIPLVESLRAMLEDAGTIAGFVVFHPFKQCWKTQQTELNQDYIRQSLIGIT